MAGRSDKLGNSGAESRESRQISPLGRAIRQFREDQGLTQEHLAELAQIDKQRITDIERGATQTLHSPTLKAIANGLGISTDELREKIQEFRMADKAGVATPQMRTGAVAPKIIHNDIRAVPGFTGREDLLQTINEALWQKGGTAALTNEATSAAVKGLGGLGKSVLAREYAWRTRERYHGVWWVRAETEQTLIDDLFDLGNRLISDLNNVKDRKLALDLALDEIAHTGRDKPWLIVYDNVEKPDAISMRTPKTGAHILITSRWARWHGYAQELPVEVFPEETAVNFLLAERQHETRKAAGRLAAALGHLPLALGHARAYCAETNLRFDEYARRLAELIQEAPEDAEYPASVFATFSLALAKATEACPEAEKLMEIIAFVAPEHIPLDIIADDVMSKKQRERAVAALFRVSLITHDMQDDGLSYHISLHRLVQEVMRAKMENYRYTVMGLSGPLCRAAAIHISHKPRKAPALIPHLAALRHFTLLETSQFDGIEKSITRDYGNQEIFDNISRTLTTYARENKTFDENINHIEYWMAMLTVSDFLGRVDLENQDDFIAYALALAANNE